MLNSRDISLLRADVSANCRAWAERCEKEGLAVLITNTVRDKAYQEYLYAQGRTRPGSIVTNGRTPTFHSDRAGLAWDFCKNVRGHEYDDPAFFRQAADLAREMGFSWGGDWKSFPDMPHIQWDDGGRWTGAMILAGRLPPRMPEWKEKTEMRYERLRDIPESNHFRAVIDMLMTAGVIGGDGSDPDGNGDMIDLSHDMVRLLVFDYRAGCYDGALRSAGLDPDLYR